MTTQKYYDIEQYTKSGFKPQKLGQKRYQSATNDLSSKFRTTGFNIKNQVVTLQSDLQGCVASINIQDKKYKILNQLIFLLKGQMYDYQKNKKKEQQVEQSKKDKQICKVQGEIDQILQKHNEQIAKIHNLKQLANSRRSQRVVYSSLFKKLQKQIKHFQQIYKEQLIISSLAKNNYKQREAKNLSCPQNIVQKNMISQPSFQESKYSYSQQKYISKANLAFNVDKIKNAERQKQQDSRCKFDYSQNHKKFFLTSDQKQSKVEKREITQNRDQKLNYTRNLLNKITEYTTFIQQLKICSESESTQTMFSHYQNIQQSNKKILQDINVCDSKLDKITRQNNILHKKINEQQFANRMITENQQCQQQIKGMPILKFHLQNFVKQLCMKNNKDLRGHLIKIGQICQIDHDDHSGQFTDQWLKSLDQKIYKISKQVQFNANQCTKRQDTLSSQSMAVDGLLQKMEKFNSSQRIFDKVFMQQQYYKQLTKKKGIKQKKQLTK